MSIDVTPAVPISDATQSTAEPVVLVVDDVRSTRDRLVRVLQSGGYSVLLASDGREALRTLTLGLHVDAILLDLEMPVMNGWEFREHQLRDKAIASIPTLVMSAQHLAAHERYTLRIGSATLIAKPFEDWQVLDPLTRIFARVHVPARAEQERWLSADGTPLLWSKRGRVACEAHAPARDTREWSAEGWTWIPWFAGKSKIEYSCQDCCGGPIRHRTDASPHELPCSEHHPRFVRARTVRNSMQAG